MVAGDVVPAFQDRSYVRSEPHREHEVVEVVGRAHLRASTAGLPANLNVQHASALVDGHVRQGHDQVLRPHQESADRHDRRQRVVQRQHYLRRGCGARLFAADQMVSAYRRFPALQVDTTHRTPEQVISSILALSPEGACWHADI
jgi:hypothetical protein